MICAPFDDIDKRIFAKTLELQVSDQLRGIKGIQDGIVVCAAGFDMWTPNSCQTHLWIRTPKDLTRYFIREVFNYLFNTCNLGLVYGITPCNNVAALRFNRKLGWKEIARVPDGYAIGTDTAIQVIRKEDCRWIDHEDSGCLKVPPQRLITQLQPRNRDSRTRH